MNDYKEYWVYKELIKEYIISVSKKRVDIKWQDGKSYGRFYIKEVDGVFIITDSHGCLLNDELEFTETYNECVCSCLYYFYTRY